MLRLKFAVAELKAVMRQHAFVCHKPNKQPVLYVQDADVYSFGVLLWSM